MSRAITVRLAFGIVIFSFLCSLFIASIFSALDPSALSGSPLGFFSYFALFVAQIFLVVPIVIFLRRNQMSLLENFRLNVITKRTVLLSMLLSFGTVMISSEINIIIDKIVPIPQSFLNLETLLSPESSVSMLLIFTTIVLIAPIGEEMVFRGFLQQYLEDYWGDITRAILATSLFFAFIHFNPYWAIQIYIMGLLLGYLSWKTKSIYPSIIVHIAINGTSMLFLALGENAEKSLLWNDHIHPLLLLLGAIAFWYGLKYIRAERVNIL